MSRSRCGVGGCGRTRLCSGCQTLLLTSVLAALFSAPVFAQSSQNIEVDHFCGQYDTDPGNIIPDCAAKSCLNVEANLSSTGISKRGGFEKIATLTVTTSPVSGSAYFRDSAGDDIVVVCNDHYCASSKNGAAFANFYSTASTTATQYSFVSYNGALYGADNAHDAVWKYDGTNFTNPANIPACSILTLDQDRMICSNTVANPNRANYSKSGDFTVWATGVNSADPFFDDLTNAGDQINGVSFWQGILYFFKQYSVIGCIPGDQYTTSCTVLTNVTGVASSQAIVQAPDGLYFAGSDGNYWKFDGFQFSIISLKIFNTIKSFASGSNGFNTQTGQQAWQAGNQSPLKSWDTLTIVGSIFPSSITVQDITKNNFNAGLNFYQIDSTTPANGIQLTSTTAYDLWNNGLTAGRLNWTPSSQFTSPPQVFNGENFVFAPEPGPSAPTVPNAIMGTSSITALSGSWSFDFLYQIAAGANDCAFDLGAVSLPNCASLRFITDSSGNSYELTIKGDGVGTNNFIALQKTVGGTTTVLTQYSEPIFGSRTTVHFEVQRGTDGRMFDLQNGVFIGSTTVDNSITSNIGSTITASGFDSGIGNKVTNGIGNFYFFKYNSSGTFISRVFDMGFSTPTYGPLSSTFSVTLNNIESQTDFYVYTSTSPNNDLWAAKIASSDTVRINVASGTRARYVKYEADMYTFISTKTPSISAVSVPTASTGTFASQCITIPNTISKWGTLNCSVQTSGGGSLVFFSSSAATCAGLPTSTMTAASQWTSTSNNGTIPISTNAVVAIRFDSTLTSSTDTAQVNSCTVNFFTGTPPPPVWGVYNPVNNAIYWSGDINTSTTTNRWFKYDLNNEGFWPFDVPAQAPLFYKNTLYFGSGGGGYWYQFAPSGVNSDDGNAINSSWTSKDWSFGEAFQEKSIGSVSLVALNQGSGSLTVTEAADGGNSSSFTVNIGTTSTTSYIRDNYQLPISSPFTFFNVQFSNNAANNPWSILGYRMDFTLNPWRAMGPP